MLCSCSLVLPILVPFGRSSAPCPQSLMFKQGARCDCGTHLGPAWRNPTLLWGKTAWAGPPDAQHLPGSAEGGLAPLGPGLSPRAPTADAPPFYKGDFSEQPTLRFWDNMAMSGLGVGRPLFWGPGGAQWGAAEAVGWGRQEPARGPPLLV